MSGGFARALCGKNADRLLAKKAYARAMKWCRWADDDERMGDALRGMGDVSSAISAYARAGNHRKAGDTARESKDYKAAAQCYLRGNEAEQAAQALIEGNDKLGAARIYADKGMKREAARLYEEMGRPGLAASLSLELGDSDAAIRLYRQARDTHGLVGAYKQKGDLTGGAEECRRHKEPLAAAALYEAAGKFREAADTLVAEGMSDAALAMYERVGAYDRLGDLYKDQGKYDAAAAAYEKAPGRESDAADLYAVLIVLQREGERQFKSSIARGMVARHAGAAVLTALNREILYVSDSWTPKWKYHLGGETVPGAIAIADDGKLVAVASDAPLGPDGNFLLLLDDEKNERWQKRSPDPIKDVAFLPGEMGMVVATADHVARIGLDGVIQWERPVDFKAWTIDVSPDGQRLAAGTLGGGLFLFDAEGGLLAQERKTERVHLASFAPDGQRLLVGVGDDKITVAGSDLKTLWAFTFPARLRQATWLAGQEALVAATASELRLLNARGMVVYAAAFDAPITTCFADPHRKTLLVALDNGALQIYAAKDCREKAAVCYTKARRLQQAAEIYRAMGQNEKAYELFREMGDYENAAAVVHLTGDVLTAARHYEVVGKYDEAARLYEETGAKYQAAKCYGKANNPRRAAELFEELGDAILAADGYEKADDRRKAGLLFLRADQAEQAIANLQDYYEGHSEDKEVTRALGDLYYQTGQYDAAIRMLQRLTDDPTLRRDALKRLGECFLKKKIHDVAVDRLTEALGDNPKPARDNIDVYYALGLTQESAGKYPEAKDTFAKVMAIDYYYMDIQERLKKAEEMSTMLARSGVPAQGQPIPAETPLAGQAQTIADHKPGRYKIVRKLGEGGMGVVYLATDTLLNRQVAWKVLPSHLAASSDYQQRLLREARAAARLSSRHIVAIYDIATDPKECSITMEYIEGETLRSKMNEQPQMPMPVALRYASQMAEALGVAHRAGVVHRDVKPENILVAKDNDEVKMLDFGLARLADDVQITREGCCVGTVRYMAPEQIKAAGVDHHSDIYALGIMLFEMLAGRPPFVGENVLAQHLYNQPPSLGALRGGVPESLAVLIDSCLEKGKEKRPDSCETLAQMFRGMAASLMGAADAKTI